MVSLRKSYNSDHYCGGVLISGNRDQIILILHHVFERKSRDRTVITEAPIRVRAYTGCTLKLRAVKLLFVIFGRLSYSLFVNLMVRGNGRLSYLILKNRPFFIEK